MLVFLSLDAAFLGVLASVWTMAFLASASVFSLSQLYALFPLFQDAADGVDDGPLPPPLPPPRRLDDNLRILLETRGETVAEVDCQAHSKIFVCNIFLCLLAPFLLLHLHVRIRRKEKKARLEKLLTSEWVRILYSS